MINKIPFLGWFSSFIASIGLSVPFWFFWTYWEAGKIYFYFIPEVFQSIPFWDCVGLFVVLSILKGTFIPKLISISNNQKVTND